MTFRRGLFTALAAVAVSSAVAFGIHAFRFRDGFVFLTIEESSANALRGLPVAWERLPGVFIDCEAKSIELGRRPLLLGVSLGVHYVASSQGIELGEEVRFSRTGRISVRIADPLSVEGRDLSGAKVEMVDNSARVVRGNLVIEKTEASGVVHLRYGDKRFSLEPGESWAELLTLSGGRVREISPESWEAEVEDCLAAGASVTRLAIANRGLWPKRNVYEVGSVLSGGAQR